MWWCAEQVHPGLKFKSYAVLGDDVVIADQEVAKVYESAVGQLGVQISYIYLIYIYIIYIIPCLSHRLSRVC